MMTDKIYVVVSSNLIPVSAFGFHSKQEAAKFWEALNPAVRNHYQVLEVCMHGKPEAQDDQTRPTS